MFLLSAFILTVLIQEGFSATCPSICLSQGIVIGSNIVGQTVIFECDAGYKRHGARYATCQKDGTWSADIPTCKLAVVRCPFIGGLDDGVVKKNEEKLAHNAPGGEVEFTCDNGFDLSGAAKLTCSETGTWDHPPPTCVDNKCKSFRYLSNGQIIFQDNTKGGKVVFQCKSGFRMVGSGNLTCLDKQTWSGDKPKCEEDICPRIYNFKYGTLSPAPGYYDNISPGSTVSFTCDPGYILKGASSITCKGNKWSAPIPKCVYSRCKWVPFLDHGTISRVGDDDFITKMLFSCDEGYKLKGSAEVDCVKKYWNNAVPRCQAYRCQNIKTFANGEISNYSRAIGTKISVKCDKGYKLESVSTAQCQNNRKWTKLPKCVKDTSEENPDQKCKQVLDLHNGRCSGGRTPGSVITCECDSRYKLDGAKTLLCKNNLNFNASLPKCVPGGCKYLSALHGGKIEGGNSVGDEARFSCFDGFTLRGPSVLKCLDNGKWSAKPPKCKFSRCSNLLIVSNGKVNGEGDTEGSTRKITCSKGYVMIGHHTLTCKNKQWTPSMPKCVRSMCTPLHYIDNGIIGGFDYSVGAKLDVRCHNYYTLKGPAQITCQSDGTWSAIPQCVLVQCPSIPLLDNGSLINYSNKRGSVVTFKCDHGHRLRGTDELVCKPDGTWSSEIPSCKGTTYCSTICIKNGVVNYRAKTVGSKASFSCMPGYKLEGASSAFCEVDGSWSEEIPTCN